MKIFRAKIHFKASPKWLFIIFLLVFHPLWVNAAEPWGDVTNNRSDSMTIINAATDEVLAIIPVGKEPHEVAITPDGKLALVPNLGTWDLSVIDVAEKRVLGSVEVGSSPVGVVVTPDSKRAYVAVYGENVVAVVDLSELRVVKRIPTGLAPDGIAIAPSPEGLKL